MSVASGKHGTLWWSGSEVTPVANWRLTIDPNIHPYHANDSGGWKKKVAGTFDSTGSFQMNERPTFDEGDKAGLVLYSEDQYIYTLDAIIGPIEHEEDILEGTPGVWDVTFEGDGIVNKTTGSSP